MKAARIARRNAIEVKLCALRKTRDGIVISFVVHPSDIPHDLMLAEIGQRYMVAMVPLGDDETPTSAEDDAESERAALAKQRYAQAGEAQKAVVRAGMLASDVTFWNWIGCHRDPDPSRRAVEFIRDRCGVASRREIGANPQAFQKFLDLEWQFQHEPGALA